MPKIKSRKLITIKRGGNEYIFTFRDMALIIYTCLVSLIIVFIFILIRDGNYVGAQLLFSLIGGMGISEILHKVKEWGEDIEE